jgi:ATP/ADP translocase
MDLNRAVTNLVSGNPEPFFLEELNLPTTFWWQTESNSSKFLFLLLIFPVIIFAYKSSRKDNVFTLGTKLSIYFLVLFAFMAIWANWHISVNYEMARYLMPWAIVLRVIFIICVVTLFENLRKRRILR